ncbi:DUF5134 domain-containing protein [Kitasatospora sp. NPDC059571]|uniref:DUF5134 domain-containing protein n=1 Tax=Kitasatospora sp. NPDC059571 TaxID=3346871 RepID=UPI003686BCF0
MHGPAVVTWLLTGLAAGSAGFCVVRLRDPACPRAHREADAAEAAMGVGMAGMAVLPGAVWGWLYAVLAGALLLGALGADGGRAHRLHHGVGALAMAYMALAMAGAPAHQHHTAPAGLPMVTGALLLYFGGYSLWAGSRLLSAPGPGALAPGGHASPGLPAARLRPAGGPTPPGSAGPRAAGPRSAGLAGVAVRACRVAMGIGMFAMLLTL